MRVVIAVMCLIVSGCGVWTSTPGVGDCAKAVDMTRDRVEMSTVDCSAPEAMYKNVDIVSGRSPSCGRGDYVTETSARNRKTERKTRSCYVLNVREGDCLVPDGDSYSRGPCGTLRVSKVVSGKADAAQCAPGEETREYSKPATTICIGR